MNRDMMVHVTPFEVHVAILEDDVLMEYYVERRKGKSILGNIYKGRVEKVLPGMQSAFVDIGIDKNAFLYVADFLEEFSEFKEDMEDDEESPRQPRTQQSQPSLQAQPAQPPQPPTQPQGGQGRGRHEGQGRPDGHRTEGAARQEPTFAEGQPRQDQPRHDGPRPEGQRQERPRHEGPRGDQHRDRTQEGRGQGRGERHPAETRHGAAFGSFLATPAPEAETEELTAPPLLVEMPEPVEAPAAPVAEEESPTGAALLAAGLARVAAAKAERERTGRGRGRDRRDNRRAAAPTPAPAPAEATLEAPAAAREAEPAKAHPAAEAKPSAEPILFELPEAPTKPVAAPQPESAPLEPIREETAAPTLEPELPAQATKSASPRPAPKKRSRKPAAKSTRKKAGEFLEAQEAEQSAAADTAFASLSLPEDESHYEGGGRRRRRGRRNYSQAAENEPGNISTMLSPGQEIIAQIIKEPISLKSARISSHVSLPGRLLVYLPTFNRVGVSRKIKTDQERKRLRSIIAANRKDRPGGFIVRTASEDCSEHDLVQDMEYLMKTWQTIQERAASQKSPVLLYEEPGVLHKILRDRVDDSFQNIWVDDEQVYTSILDFVDVFMPDATSRVKLYSKEEPIFDFFSLTAEIEKAHKPKVWLRSGGFLVINHAEALVAIDVNTGRYVGKGSNFEDTITKINTDAAREIARQIRLRNLGGIIVMDFIDMQEKKNRKQVMDTLMAELKRDKAPSKILQFNDFGLVIMTRKRTASALDRNLSEPCTVCEGTGYIKSPATVCYEIYAHAERMRVPLSTSRRVIVRAHPEVIRALKGEEREVHEELKDLLEKDVVLLPDHRLSQQDFDVTAE